MKYMVHIKPCWGKGWSGNFGLFLSCLIIGRGTDTSQKLVWILLTLDGQLLGLANLHASNDEQDLC